MASFNAPNEALNKETQQPQQHDLPAYTPSVRTSTFRPSSSSKPAGSFNRHFHNITSKAGWPLNKAANVIGAEGWWPTSMEKECNKAARILHSFTSLGAPQPPSKDGPMHPTGLTKKSMVKIPDAVLRNCAGLAIFNVIRAGAVHGSLAAGSGVVIARLPDGTWSPPSSFVATTIGAGFMFGLDIYDCVCVLNTPEQVNGFANPRFSLGGEASIAVGPVGTGASVDAAVSKTVRPMWTYMKSRGLWAGVQIDGTIIVTRADANAVFYDQKGISAKKILRGDVAWPMGAKPLFEVLKAIEGRPDFDRTVVQEVGMMASPGDVIPDNDDKKDPTVLQDQHAQTEYYDDTVMDEKERLAKAGY
ncbi:SH3 domain-containing protein [Cladobotryum mycophilum]|uniref:SH3 domain-containing protein n=1 Tax=Cladobotryum mycophilum TaxID=491253 RepID=A0ABR0SVI7_9HYPO